MISPRAPIASTGTTARGAIALVTLFALAAALCAPAGANPTDRRAPGTLVASTPLERYPAFAFRLALGLASASGRADLGGEIAIDSGAALYRLTYWTRDAVGEPVVASGLVAIPFRRPPRGIVSYLHGTTTKRSFVPSQPNIEGRVAAAVFAGAGYLLAAPDYTGLGRSRTLHPYLHAEATANAAIDLLAALRAFCTKKRLDCPWRLGLFGASQGGHGVAAVQRRIEAGDDRGYTLLAAAAAAGAFDLAGIAFPFALEGGSRSHTVYLAYLTYAYAGIYDEPIAGVIASPWAERLPRLFDGATDNADITDALPRRPRDLFRPEFLAAYDHGEPTWLLAALERNEAFRFAPRAPLRLYYGEHDRDVSPEESIRAAAEMQRRGGRAEAISVGPLGHQDSAFQSVAPVRRWFDAVFAVP